MAEDTYVIELLRPMSADALQKAIRLRQGEREEEIAELEAKLAEQDELGQPQDPAWQKKLEALRNYNGKGDAEAILAGNTIKIAVHSVTRKEAFRRGKLQTQAREWLLGQLGVEKWGDVNTNELPEELAEHWVMMYQAADIIPALVPEECRGWKIPEKLEDWPGVKDYIFERALAETWALNPQFLVNRESGEV